MHAVAGTPINVTAIRTGYNSVKVSWTAPSTKPLPAACRYEVTYRLTGGGSIVNEGITSNTELTLTGLTLGNYFIDVTNYGAEGDLVLPSSSVISIEIGNSTVCYIYMHAVYFDENFLLFADIPQLQSAPILISSTSTIIVSWSPTQFTPDGYRISYSCQHLCNLSVTYLTLSDDTEPPAYTIAADPSSMCDVYVTAIFGNSNSNTINAMTTTLFAGIHTTH